MNKKQKLPRDNLKLKAGTARGFCRPNKKIASLTLTSHISMKAR